MAGALSDMTGDPSKAWEAGLDTLGDTPSVLQSYAWGEVQQQFGWQVNRIHLAGIPTTVLLRRGAAPLAYIPRGPACRAAELGEAAAAAERWAREHGAWALRIDPALEGADFQAPARWRRAEPVQPRHSAILSLQPDQEALLAGFHPKTRYNIRLAQRHGVVTGLGKAEVLSRLAAETAGRHGIGLPDAAFFDAVLERFGGDAAILQATHEGLALAALLVVAYRGRAVYLYGGSTLGRRELMAPHLIQWAAILWAVEHGCAEYDLWGMPPPGHAAGHPWAGIGRFKAGFNGRPVSYPRAAEVILRPVAYRAAELARGWGRRIRRL